MRKSRDLLPKSVVTQTTLHSTFWQQDSDMNLLPVISFSLRPKIPQSLSLSLSTESPLLALKQLLVLFLSRQFTFPADYFLLLYRTQGEGMAQGFLGATSNVARIKQVKSRIKNCPTHVHKLHSIKTQNFTNGPSVYFKLIIMAPWSKVHHYKFIT